MKTTTDLFRIWSLLLNLIFGILQNLRKLRKSHDWKSAYSVKKGWIRKSHYRESLPMSTLTTWIKLRGSNYCWRILSTTSCHHQAITYRCWCRMMETKYVGDNFEMLVTVLAVFVTRSSSFTISVGHQNPKDVTNN